MPKIVFHSADRTLNIPVKRKIKAFIPTLFLKENITLDRLDYVFCSDEYLLAINNTHLNHDFYTDIITFDLSENNATIGEIYISIDRVKENAAQLDNSFIDEILRVIFHGALHLCGYKDKTKQQAILMRSKEEDYIKEFKMLHVEHKSMS